MEKVSIFLGFYRNVIYERNETKIVTFQKIRTKDIGLFKFMRTPTEAALNIVHIV